MNGFIGEKFALLFFSSALFCASAVAQTSAAENTDSTTKPIGYEELTSEDSYWSQSGDDSTPLALDLEWDWGSSRDGLTQRNWRSYYNVNLPFSLEFNSSSTIDTSRVLPGHSLSQGTTTLNYHPEGHFNFALSQAITAVHLIEDEQITSFGASLRMNVLLHKDGQSGISLGLYRHGLNANLWNQPFPTDYVTTALNIGISESISMSAYAGQSVRSDFRDYAYGLELAFTL